MSCFTLSTRLNNDSFFIISMELCQVRLMNNQDFVWLLLIPQVNDAVYLTDLSSEQQQTLMQEINKVSLILKKYFNPARINIATLGNIVSQMHWHIVARYENDKAWPSPVWGMSSTPYQDAQKNEIISLFQDMLSIKYGNKS